MKTKFFPIFSTILLMTLGSGSHADVFSLFTFDDGTDLTDTSNTGTTGSGWNQDVGDGSSISGGSVTIGDLNPNTFSNQSYSTLGDNTFRQVNNSVRYVILEDVQVDFEGGSAGGDRYGFGISAKNFTGSDNELASIHLLRNSSDTQDLFLQGYSEGTGASTGLTLIGDEYVVNGGADTTALFDFVLEIDMGTDTYEIFWREGTNAYASIGSAALNTVDPNSSATMYIDNAGLSSNGENITIGSISFTDVNPIPEPSTIALEGLTGLAALFAVRRRK